MAGRAQPTTSGMTPGATFFVAIGDLLVEAGRSAPVLLVLDDLQWARRPTLQLVGSPPPLAVAGPALHPRHPSRHAAPTPTTRSPTRSPSCTASKAPRACTCAGSTTRACVRSSKLAAGADLDAALEQAVAVLARQTDGNPFLLGELWHHLVDMGALVPADGGWRVTAGLDALTTPESVRSVVGRRIDRLPADARELLEVAAVAGSPFGVDLLAGATEHERRTRPRTPRTGDRDRERSNKWGRRPSGSPTNSSKARCTTASRRRARRRAHFDLATAIERHGVSDRTLPDLARHSIAAIPIVDVQDADRGHDAGGRRRDARVRLRRRGRTAEFRAAVRRCRRRPRRVVVARGQGRDPRWRDRAIARAPAHRDRPRPVGSPLRPRARRAALAFEESGWRLGLPGDEAERLLREAMPYAADESTRFRALAARGRALALSGDPAAENVIDQAIREARAHGDDRLLQFALVTWFNVGLYPEKYPSMLDRVTELRALSARTDDIANAMHAEHWRTLALMLNAQFGEIAETAAECSRLAQLSGDPFHGHLECRVALDARALRRPVRRRGAARRRSERTRGAALGRRAVRRLRRADVLVAAGAGPARRGPARRRGRSATRAAHTQRGGRAWPRYTQSWACSTRPAPR